MNNKPLKRRKELQALSRDHHHGLLLGWKIREGFRNEIEHERINKYVQWFWNNHLKDHFEREEKWVFPLLGHNHPLVRRALTEHRRLERLINANRDLHKNLSLLEEEIEIHIRFEERSLFKAIQDKLDELDNTQIAQLEKELNHPTFNENYQDQFWSNK